MADNKNIEIIAPIDYNELLQQTVAVLENARMAIARSVAGNVTQLSHPQSSKSPIDGHWTHPPGGAETYKFYFFDGVDYKPACGKK